jgi:hypothetical protein
MVGDEDDKVIDADEVDVYISHDTPKDFSLNAYTKLSLDIWLVGWMSLKIRPLLGKGM